MTKSFLILPTFLALSFSQNVRGEQLLRGRERRLDEHPQNGCNLVTTSTITSDFGFHVYGNPTRSNVNSAVPSDLPQPGSSEWIIDNVPCPYTPFFTPEDTCQIISMKATGLRMAYRTRTGSIKLTPKDSPLTLENFFHFRHDGPNNQITWLTAAHANTIIPNGTTPNKFSFNGQAFGYPLDDRFWTIQQEGFECA